MRTEKRFHIWPLVGLCLVMASYSPAIAAPQYLARSWQSEDGLPSNVVRAVAQAADGYLWVGTAEGLVRFDGHRFTGFRSGTDAALARQSIRALFALPNGDVWVTTSGGALLHGHGGRLDEVSLPPIADGSVVRSISHVVMDATGRILVLDGTDVLQVTSGKAVQLTERTPALEQLLRQTVTREPEEGRPVQGESGVRLRSARGELWQFTSGAGLTLTRLDGQTVTVSMQPDAPSGARAMMEDREGNLWVGSHSQGLWRLRPSRVSVVTTADGLSDRTTLLSLEDNTGALWIAPQAGGLDRLKDGVMQHFEVGTGPARRPIAALLQTRAGVLWAATRDAQVHVWNGDGFSPAFSAGRGPGKILAMAEDERARVWFGGRYGLSVWDSSGLRLNVDFGRPEVVTALMIAGPDVWAGTESGRIYRGADERFEPIAGADAFARQPISNLLADEQGTLWVGTMGGGLFHLQDGRAQALATRMSEVDPRITCLLDDTAGFLWMGTLGGICRAEKAKLLSPAPPTTGSTLILDRSDGLLTRECTRSGQPAGWRGHDGTLYFSTGNGVARVHPEQLAVNRITPSIVIEEARAEGRALPLNAHGLRVGPGRSRLEFRFTALTFTSPEKVRFRTRLEGLDESWHDVGNQRTLAYEAIPPGRYEFHVTADNGDGVWNETGATLGIEVLPHFWERRGFQAGVALLAAALAVAIGALITRSRMRGRMLRLEAITSREKERARIAQDLHDDLGASLTEISLLANLAAEDRQPADKADDTLPEVAAKAQALVGALDEIVWAVNPRHDTLRSLAEYLAAFGGKFLSRAGITMRRDVPRDLPDVSLDAERRHNVFLAVREALNNTVKHSGATEVWLRMRLEGAKLIVSIEDNGRGISEGTDELSEGLLGMRDRMARIGGNCQIESDSGGTRVCLSLPLPSAK